MDGWMGGCAILHSPKGVRRYPGLGAIFIPGPGTATYRPCRDRCPVPAPVRTPHKTWRRNTIGAREESEETEGTRGPGWFPFPSTCLRCGQERQKRQELARHWAAGIREGAARWAGLGWARWAGLGTSWPMGTSWAGSRGWHDELAGAGRVSHGDGREGGRDSHGCMARAREGGRHGLLDLRHGVASCNATQRNATPGRRAGSCMPRLPVSSLRENDKPLYSGPRTRTVADRYSRPGGYDRYHRLLQPAAGAT